jgi:hypothetical protein
MHLGMGLILFIMILTVFLDVKEISKKISPNRLRMTNPSE